LQALFRQAGKSKGPIPVRGTLNGKRFRQTVVKYQGAWRLYLNTEMRREAGVEVGDVARVEIEFDPAPRAAPMHPVLGRALAKNKAARVAFEKLRPSHQKEILRYLNSLKSEKSAARNVEKVIRQLTGKPAKNVLSRRYR
jgi:hypothetical protein